MAVSLRHALWAAATAMAAILLLAAPARGQSDDDAARALAARHAPIVVVRDQSGACDRDGEAYRPVPVETVLGKPGIRLRDESKAVVMDAPGMRDIVGRGPGTSLDFPGNPRRPGCGFEKDFDRFGAGQPDVAYAHVATDPSAPGRLALQYWFFWYFDDYVNTHEGDWEFIQLVWDVATPEEALLTPPAEVGYSQHSGGERADWDGDKLEREGDRPVVYAAAGSHANYFTPDLFLGRNADQGFGCDNARPPGTRLPTQARLLPSGGVDPNGPHAWMLFEGRWGEFQPTPYDAPPGPATKGEWSAPIEWQESLRDGSFAIPTNSTLGPAVTSSFCAVVKAGGQLYTAVTSPAVLLLIVLGLVTSAGVAVRSTAWSPRIIHPLRRARAAGQIIRAALASYRRRRGVLLAVGLLFLPAAALEVAAQHALVELTPFGHLTDVAGEDHLVSAAIALLAAGAGHALAATVVVGGVAIVLDAAERGHEPGVRWAYRAVFAAAPRLLATGLRVGVVTLLLGVTVVGIPWAIALLGRWAVAVQAAAIEGVPSGEAVRRSRELVRGRWWRTAAIAATVNVIGAVSGPVVGIVLLFVTSLPLATVNTVGSLVYVAVMPFVGAALAFLYGDLVARRPGR